MSVPPKNYRLYSYDLTRKAVSADFIKALSDDEVIAKVKAGGFGSKCEIWDGKRLVAQIDADRQQA